MQTSGFWKAWIWDVPCAHSRVHDVELQDPKSWTKNLERENRKSPNPKPYALNTKSRIAGVPDEGVPE